MYVRGIFRIKRNLGVEYNDGKKRICHQPHSLGSVLDHIIPTCSDGQPASTTTTTAPLVEVSASSTIISESPPVTSGTSSSVAAATFVPQPPESSSSLETSRSSSITTLLETATVIPESSVQSVVPLISASLARSSIPSIAPIFVPTSPLDTHESSKSTTASRIGSIASKSHTQTSTSTESATRITTSIQSTPFSSMTTISTSQSSDNTFTTPIPKSIADHSILSPSTHLSANSKVAIVSAIVLTALALTVGALYLLKRRRRAARARRSATFTMLTGNDTVNDGDDTRLVTTRTTTPMAQRQMGTNGYPQDIKMEDNTLLRDTEAGGVGSRLQSPAIAKQSPLLIDGGGIVTNDERPNTTGEPSPASTEFKIGVATPMAISGRGKTDLVALPKPTTIAVARAISDSSSRSAEEKREKRINALSMARTLSDGDISNRGSWDTTPLAINKTKVNTPSITNSNSGQSISSSKGKSRFSGRGRIRNLRIGGGSANGSSNEVEEKVWMKQRFDPKEILLSEESQELNSLTQECEDERVQKEKNRVEDARKCMAKDRNVKVESPTLLGLDAKKGGCA